MKNLNRPVTYPHIPGLTVSYKAPVPANLDHLFLSMPGMVIIANPDYTIRNVNELAADFFGLSAAQAAGSHLGGLVDWRSPDTHWETIFQEVESRGNWQGMVAFNAGLHGLQYFQASLHKLFDADGQAQSLVLVLQDKSMLRPGQDALNRVETKYRTVVESLSEGGDPDETGYEHRNMQPACCRYTGLFHG